MNVKEMLKKHYLRLVHEAGVKSALAGLAVGFCANFIAALAAWVFDFGGIWFAIGVGLGAWLAGGVLIYFLKFKPTVNETAERMDRLGLEERMITMLELKDDDSYIATIQRENTRASIARVTDRKIKLRIPKAVICFVVIAAVCGSSMTTVTGLASNDVIPSFQETVGAEEEDPYANYFAVTYMAEEGGYIEGETDQLVEPGGSTTPVVAKADDGWIFVGWEDGRSDTERYETKVNSDMYFVALFEEIGESEGGAEGDEGANGDGSDSSEGDQAEDLPANGSANVESDQSGAQGSEGDGQGNKGESDGGQGSSDEQGEGKGDGKGQGAGGKWDDANKFIDGEQYYKNQVDDYYQKALEYLEEYGEIPPEMLEFFETYFESL